MTTYNGHKNWNHWNASPHINNDEFLYRAAVSITARYPQARESAARHMLGWLKDEGLKYTPDGAPYNLVSVKAAMRGMLPSQSPKA